MRACVHVQNDEQVDLIAVMFGTFQHMYTNDDALRAMKSIARNLKPGGLFVLEFSHPALLFDGSVVSSADTWSHEVEDAQVEVCRLAPKIASSSDGMMSQTLFSTFYMSLTTLQCQLTPC